MILKISAAVAALLLGLEAAPASASCCTCACSSAHHRVVYRHHVRHVSVTHTVYERQDYSYGDYGAPYPPPPAPVYYQTYYAPPPVYYAAPAYYGGYYGPVVFGGRYVRHFGYFGGFHGHRWR